MTTMERFLSKIHVHPMGGCWEWSGAKNRDGYGQFRHDGMQNAHSVSYELHIWPVPTGLELDHLCRNRGCVNPHHLQPVTHAENVRRGQLVKANRERGAATTHCKHGHEFAKENTYTRSNGTRACRECRADRDRKRREKERSARNG